MSEQKRGGGGFLFGLLVGGLIGGAIAILLAPKLGADAMKAVRAKGAAFTGPTPSPAPSSGQMATGGMMEVAEDVRDIIREAVEEAREVLRDAMAQGREARERTQAELQREYEQVRQNPPAQG